MNQEMDSYIRNLQFFIQKELYSEHYFRTKVKELFYLSRAFYIKEELACFFPEKHWRWMQISPF